MQVQKWTEGKRRRRENSPNLTSTHKTNKPTPQKPKQPNKNHKQWGKVCHYFLELLELKPEAGALVLRLWNPPARHVYPTPSSAQEVTVLPPPRTVSSAGRDLPNKRPGAADDPGRTQRQLSFPSCWLFNILHDNIFQLLEEIYICSIKSEKVN